MLCAYEYLSGGLQANTQGKTTLIFYKYLLKLQTCIISSRVLASFLESFATQITLIYLHHETLPMQRIFHQQSFTEMKQNSLIPIDTGYHFLHIILIRVRVKLNACKLTLPLKRLKQKC